MAISYINKNATAGKATSLTGVTAGNLIVAMIQYSESTGIPTLSDGTNSPDAYSTKAGGVEWIRFAYWLSSPKSGTVTYTWTLADGEGHTAHVFEMSCSGVWALEHINAGDASSGTVATSTNETSSETSMVAFGGGGMNQAYAYSSATIDGSAVDQHASVVDGSFGSSGSLTMRVLNNPGTYNSAITFAGSGGWSADLIGFKETSSATIEQEGFRFRNDDGSESTATWKADQDVNITLAATTAFRLRMILNATGDPASIGAQLECRYKPSGGAFGSWAKVTS